MEKKQDETTYNEQQTEATAEQAETQNEQNAALEDTFKLQFMRVSADFANYKRRVEKDRTEWIVSGQKSLIMSFLPFLDDFERALEATRAAATEETAETVLKGFELIYKNLKKTFDDLGIEEIDCSKEFNPDFHEALMQIDSQEHESGQIVSVLTRGYMFKGSVVRHAKVSVAR